MYILTWQILKRICHCTDLQYSRESDIHQQLLHKSSDFLTMFNLNTVLRQNVTSIILHLRMFEGTKQSSFNPVECFVQYTNMVWTASSEFGTYRLCEQWVERNLQTESQIPGPSEWLGMRSYLSWRNVRRHKFAWRGSCNHFMQSGLLKYKGRVKRICVFEHSVKTNFNCACPAIQRGQGSGFLFEGSSWLTACMFEQRRFWDSQARLNLRCSHRR